MIKIYLLIINNPTGRRDKIFGEGGYSLSLIIGSLSFIGGLKSYWCYAQNKHSLSSSTRRRPISPRPIFQKYANLGLDQFFKNRQIRPMTPIFSAFCFVNTSSFFITPYQKIYHFFNLSCKIFYFDSFLLKI